MFSMTRNLSRLRTLDARLLILANSTSDLSVRLNELKLLRERVTKAQQVVQQPRISPLERSSAQVELRL
jgi:hypothetical protein